MVTEEERDRSRRDKEEHIAKEEGRLVDAHQEILKAAKKRKEARLALRLEAFGASGLFGPGSDMLFTAGEPAPDAPGAVAVEAYEALPGVRGEVAWSRHVVGGYPGSAGLGG